MNRLRSYSFYPLVFILIACSKPGGDEPAPGPPSPNPVVAKPKGILYIDCTDSFSKVSTADSSLIWRSSIVHYAGSAGNPMTLDENSFYHGNRANLSSYSRNTGARNWTLTSSNSAQVPSYREAVSVDSLVFAASVTTPYAGANLYGVDTKTGKPKWQKQIDFGKWSKFFNAIPIISGNKVIIQTRNALDKRYLTAFDISSGTQLWNTAISDSVSERLVLNNGKIYSTYFQTLYCFDASNGTLVWEKEMPFFPYHQVATFFDDNKMIVVKANIHQYNILEIDIITGALIRKSTLLVDMEKAASGELSPRSSMYVNNSLWIMTPHSLDSLSIYSFDLSSLKLKWHKKWANYFYNWPETVVTDKYILFATTDSYPEKKCIMHFLDYDGNEITEIPYRALYAHGFSYEEEGKIYSPRPYLFRP